MVVSPTRELAIQIADQCAILFRDTPYNYLCAYGGTDVQQNRKNASAEVVVGTPGRLVDLLSRKWIDATDIQAVVIDEADRLMDMNFLEDISAILNMIKKARNSKIDKQEDIQLLMFSATVPRWMTKMCWKWMRADWTTVDIVSQQTAEIPTLIEHIAIE